MCIRDSHLDAQREQPRKTNPQELRGGSCCHIRAQRETWRIMGPSRAPGTESEPIFGFLIYHHQHTHAVPRFAT
eukprot:9939337-Alexandrium_andersonii.AAC.1